MTGKKEREPVTKAANPLRFIVFLLLVVAVLAYVQYRWGEFSKETATRGGFPAPGAVAGLTGDDVADGELAVQNQGRDYYVEARLARDESRSEEIELLKELAADDESSPAVREEAQRKLMAIATRQEQERQAESLIRSRGFQDVLVFVYEGGAVAMVPDQDLEAAEVARVADAITRVTGLDPAKVSIMARPR